MSWCIMEGDPYNNLRVWLVPLLTPVPSHRNLSSQYSDKCETNFLVHTLPYDSFTFQVTNLTPQIFPSVYDLRITYDFYGRSQIMAHDRGPFQFVEFFTTK